MRVDYLDEAIDGDVAMVWTAIVRRGGGEVLFDYAMIRHEERWPVRDIFVEGVSLVANLRSQFQRILRDSSYPGLVIRMKARSVARAGGYRHRTGRAARRAGADQGQSLARAQLDECQSSSAKLITTPCGSETSKYRSPQSASLGRSGARPLSTRFRWSASTPRTRRITRVPGWPVLTGASRRLMTLWPARIVVKGALAPPYSTSNPSLV